MIYCNFQDTGKVFNGKKVYKCYNCDLELGLDDPDTKVLCFAEDMKLKKALMEKYQHEMEELDKQDIDIGEINETDLCSKEQIDERLAICNSCEHYQDNSCLLCGCRIVREKNYQNKLANKNASCPDNKWGPIN